MESNSRPCHIRVSDATYRKLTPFVKNTFVHETLQIKGKGNMLTHIVRVDDLPHF